MTATYDTYGKPGADWLIEVPHGADEQVCYDTFRPLLHSPLPDGLEDFFQVNTDVGSWALALALRDALTDRGERVSMIRCLVPRTFIDVNRVLDAGVQGLTPGLPPWITDPRDDLLLRGHHEAYTKKCEALYAQVCANHGKVLIPHTYAPRSVPVTVGPTIVQDLHAFYDTDRILECPLRPEVDFITATPDGHDLAPEGWQRVIGELAQAGVEVATNSSYNLHPVTMGAHWSARHPGKVLCFEVRRDLVTHWDPFQPKPLRTARIKAIAEAIIAGLC